MKAKMFSLVVMALSASHAYAEVRNVAPAGFEVVQSVTVQESAGRVYSALGMIGRWWSPEHTITGKAENLHLDLKVGGCFCERSKDGIQRLHLTVVAVDPGKFVRLRGALGPLQGEGVDGALTWTIRQNDKGVDLEQDYIVGGYLRDGSAKWAPLVDAVLGQQLVRFKAFVETGSPVTVAKP